MGRGPTVKTETREQIETLWAEKPFRTAKWVHQQTANFSPRPKLRTVQQIIRDAKRRAIPIPDDPLIVAWGDDWPEDPDQIAVLFRVMASARVALNYRLTTREARWVIALSGLFDYSGLGDADEGHLAYEHFLFARSYAQRERVGVILDRQPYFDDLDGLVMFSPWATNKEQRLESYQSAVQNGLVPSYNPDIFIEAGEAIYSGYTEASEAMWKIREVAIAMEEETNAEDLQDAESVPDETPESSSAMVDLWKQIDWVLAMTAQQSFISEGQITAQGDEDWDDSKDKVLFEAREKGIQEIVGLIYATPEGKAAHEQFLKATTIVPRVRVSEPWN